MGSAVQKLTATFLVLLAAGGSVVSTSCAEDGGAPPDGTGASGGATGGEGGTTAGSGGGTTGPCDDVVCADGEICQNGNCIMGCETNPDCGPGLSCCGGGCIDVATDINHCGACDDACGMPDNQSVTCDAGMCLFGACDPGFVDCNGSAADGCETEGQCSCDPGATQACYPGPPNTAGVGICHEGFQKCNQAGNAWSLCFDFQIPVTEICANNTDEDCSGVDDDIADLDSDGWTICDNDCCDDTVNCSIPGLVNPGAFEVVGNMVDDDCDPATSDTVAAPACSAAEKLSGMTAGDVASAMDLCQTTTSSPPLAQRKWGLIDAEFRTADGNAPSAAQLNTITSLQTAVLTNYGTAGIVPQQGATMAGISTGVMRDAGDAGFASPNPGTRHGHVGTPPAGYLTANGGTLPTSQACNGNQTCDAGTGANDSVNVRLTIRVPTNAQSFAYQFRFLSSEFWEWHCTAFNDFFLALLTTGAAGIPPDGNISFDSLNNPVSVNNGFFEHCEATSCYTCPLGTAVLAGTGMDEIDGPPGPSGTTGGATVWLETTAPVVPGETMVLELMIFDVSDDRLDSVSLLDAFEWSVDASGVGTGPAG